MEKLVRLVDYNLTTSTATTIEAAKKKEGNSPWKLLK